MVHLLLLIPTALGHAGAAIESVDVLLPAHNEDIYLEASIGLIHQPAEGELQMLCHEAITSPDAILLPRYTVASDDTLYGWIRDLTQARDAGSGLYRSEDGCTWTAPDGLTDVPIASVAVDHGDPLHVVVASSTPGGAAYRSTDGGLSFRRLGFSLAPGERYTSVISRRDGVFWAASQSDTTLRVHHSTNGGRDWIIHEVAADFSDPSDLPYLHVMEAPAGDPNTAWLRVDYLSRDLLLETRDGGETTEVRHELEGYFTDVAVDPSGTLWLAINGLGFSYALLGQDFQLAAAPPGLGVGTRGDTTWVTARFEMTNQALLSGTRTEPFTPVLDFFDITGPRACPDDSDAGQTCLDAWAVLGPVLQRRVDTGLPAEDTDDPTSPVDPAPPSASCGCSSVQPSIMGLLGGLLALWPWRRRRQREDAPSRLGGALHRTQLS